MLVFKNKEIIYRYARGGSSISIAVVGAGLLDTIVDVITKVASSNVGKVVGDAALTGAKKGTEYAIQKGLEKTADKIFSPKPIKKKGSGYAQKQLSRIVGSGIKVWN